MQYLCVITFLIATATAFTRRNDLKHLLRHLDRTQTDLSSVEEKWIEQPLDHFDTSEKRTYKMRYFENLQFWKQNGPIYIFIGGELEQDPRWISGNDKILIDQLAKETNAAMFASEHRYYGRSLPDLTKDNTVEYYKFLSSHQALEDLASLIKMIKSDSSFKSSKVAVIGGSYPGNLAAWMRELYPDLVDAAVASSAPVLAKKDFKEYLDTVRYTFGKYGTDNCLQKIEKDFKKIEDLLKTKEGIEELKKELDICPQSDMSVLENQELLFRMLYLQFMNISQYETPYDVKNWCENVKSYHLKPINPVFHRAGCTSIDYKSLDYTKSKFAPWIYQYCTEFGYLQTTSAEKQPFVHWNPVKFELRTCKDFVKGDLEKIMDEGIAKTNKRYGGLTPNVTKVVFTHGDMDPWHTLGVLKDLGPDAPARMVNGTSHCRVLCEHPAEPKEMTENRKYVKELIKKWITQ